jgi:hypothetical protein
MNLGSHEHQIAGITLAKVPVVGLQLVANMVNEPLRPIKVHGFISAHQNSQQSVKANEMVDVGVGYEDVVKPHNLAWGERFETSKVNKDGPIFEQNFDIERRITGSSVNESGIKQRSHEINSTTEVFALPAHHVRHSWRRGK